MDVVHSKSDLKLASLLLGGVSLTGGCASPFDPSPPVTVFDPLASRTASPITTFLLGSLLLEEEDPDGLEELEEEDDPEGLEELEDELFPAAAAAAFAFSRSLSLRACSFAF